MWLKAEGRGYWTSIQCLTEVMPCRKLWYQKLHLWNSSHFALVCHALQCTKSMLQAYGYDAHPTYHICICMWACNGQVEAKWILCLEQSPVSSLRAQRIVSSRGHLPYRHCSNISKMKNRMVCNCVGMWQAIYWSVNGGKFINLILLL